MVEARFLRSLAAAAVLAGVAVRVLFLAEKPFWRDEAWVAALATGEIDGVLSTTRPSPVGFLLLVKLVASIAGAVPGVPPEVSLRLVPLACGVAALVALTRLARALGAPAVVPVTALLLAAGAPPLVYYSRELKHYGVDLLFAVLVPLLALGFFRRHAAAGGRAAGSGGGLAVSLAAAPWVSFASAFAIAGTIAWGWLGPWRRSPPRLRRRWAALSLLYLLSLCLSYVLVVHRLAGNERLVAYWARALAAGDGLPVPLGALRVLGECVRVPSAYFFPGLEPVALSLAALGLAGWPRPGGGIFRQIALFTLLLTTAAVLADRYVAAHGRLLLFTAPLLLLSVAAGLAQLGGFLAPLLGRRAATAVPLAAGATALLLWSGTAVAHRLPPYRNDTARYFRYDILHDVEPLIAAAARAAGPGEPVLVSPASAKVFRWYARGRLPEATVTAPPFRVAEARRVLRGWRGKRRGWLILLDEEQRFWSGAIPGTGLVHSPAAVSRGAQLWELRQGAGRPRAGKRR